MKFKKLHFLFIILLLLSLGCTESTDEILSRLKVEKENLIAEQKKVVAEQEIIKAEITKKLNKAKEEQGAIRTLLFDTKEVNKLESQIKEANTNIEQIKIEFKEKISTVEEQIKNQPSPFFMTGVTIFVVVGFIILLITLGPGILS